MRTKEPVARCSELTGEREPRSRCAPAFTQANSTAATIWARLRQREARLSPAEKKARSEECERQQLRLAAAGVRSDDPVISAISVKFLLRHRGAA